MSFCSCSFLYVKAVCWQSTVVVNRLYVCAGYQQLICAVNAARQQQRCRALFMCDILKTQLMLSATQMPCHHFYDWANRWLQVPCLHRREECSVCWCISAQDWRMGRCAWQIFDYSDPLLPQKVVHEGFNISIASDRSGTTSDVFSCLLKMWLDYKNKMGESCYLCKLSHDHMVYHMTSSGTVETWDSMKHIFNSKCVHTFLCTCKSAENNTLGPNQLVDSFPITAWQVGHFYGYME